MKLNTLAAVMAGLAAIGLLSGCSGAQAGTGGQAPGAAPAGFPPDKIGNLSRLSDRQAFDHWYLAGAPTAGAGGATASPASADGYNAQISAAASSRFSNYFKVSPSHIKSAITYQYAYLDSPTGVASPTNTPTFFSGLDPNTGLFEQNKRVGGSTGTLQLDVFTLNDDFTPSVADTMTTAAGMLSVTPTTTVGNDAVYNNDGEYLAVGQHRFLIAFYEGGDSTVDVIKGLAQQMEDSGVLK